MIESFIEAPSRMDSAPGMASNVQMSTAAVKNLASKVIRDAIQDAKKYKNDRRGRLAKAFLLDDEELSFWLDRLDFQDVDYIKKSILNMFKSERKKKKTRTMPMPKKGIRHGKKIISVLQASKMLNVSYSTLYRRHLRYPNYSLAKLKTVI